MAKQFKNQNKTCKQCQEAEAYSKLLCEKCYKKQYRKRWYKKNKEHHNEVCREYARDYMPGYFLRIREELFAHYGNKCCQCDADNIKELMLRNPKGSWLSLAQLKTPWHVLKWCKANNWPKGLYVVCRQCYRESLKKGSVEINGKKVK